MGQIQLLIHTFNWHSPSWDLFILAFWLVASVLFAFAAGRGRMLLILVCTYMAQLLVIKAPFLSHLAADKFNIAGSSSMAQLAAFAVLFLVFFVFLGRYAFRSTADGRQILALPFTLIFTVLQVGLLINIVLSYLPDQIKNSFTPLIQFLFLHPNAGFIWLLAPIIFLILVGRFVSDQLDN
ncbi:MAG TPA: hypothetical protein VHQ41_01390 [Patescibacteria group bacterium]|jgi:hypothetical protein|nr:hypothetical protein [Patescibacteria group bacterium]